MTEVNPCPTCGYQIDRVNRINNENARLQEAKRRALKVADERAIEANGVRQENARLRAARIAEREMIANTAREWAEHYPQSSDGRNTFVLFAEWVERGAAEQEVREKGTT